MSAATRGRGRFRRCAPLLAAIGALALLPASAGAATVFGPDMTLTPGQNTSDLDIVNVINADGTPDTGAPVSGILVSVRVKTQGLAGAGVVRVLTEVSHPDATTYTFNNTAPEIPVSVTPDSGGGHITEVLTRRPITAGQRLGWRSTLNPEGFEIQFNDPDGECAYTTGDHPVGDDLTYSTNFCNHNLLMISGTIEADADGDGFGDETQDGCPSDASTQGACPAVTPPPGSSAPIPGAKKKCKKKHKKHAAGVAKKKKCKKKKRR
jgi:hypothetical protein